MVEGFKDKIENRTVSNTVYSHMQTHWKLYATEGYLFIILGIAAYVLPHLIPKGVSLFLGSLLLIVGLLQVARSVIFITIPGLNLFLLTGLVQSAIGLYFLTVEPSKGRLILTMLFVVLFSIEGIIKVIFAFMLRPLMQRNEMFFSGATSIAMVIVILTDWPETASWPLGLILGVNMVLFGSCLLNLGLSQKPVS